VAAALRAEAAAYIDARAHEVDDNGRRRVRNGYHQSRDVLTVAGAWKSLRAGQRQAPRPRYRSAAAILLDDPAGVSA
jgi:hypothetical protein